MYICRGHFLAQYAVALGADGKAISHMIAVDTELMIAQRLTGFDPENGKEITDLVKVTKVFLVENDMPDSLIRLLPEGIELVTAIQKEEEQDGKVSID